ncbi:hypothetical protein E4T47_05414 [Aureobasidium subglaciale]|nr:hypothetical protein E4T47_05414 [Aureobasidium subglaciale]
MGCGMLMFFQGTKVTTQDEPGSASAESQTGTEPATSGRSEDARGCGHGRGKMEERGSGRDCAWARRAATSSAEKQQPKAIKVICPSFFQTPEQKMGILSNLLTQYSGGDEKAKTEQAVVPPVLETQQQSPTQAISQNPSQSPKLNGLLSVDDDLREKMRTNPRARTVRQLSLFFAGATFFGLSLVVTRRAVARKLAASAPRQFTPSNFQPKDVNGGVEAAQAFALATLNVTSAAMMATGGMMYALDVTDTEDMRSKFRKSWGFERTALEEAEQDEEMEKMVKEFMDKKEGGDNKGMAEGLAGLVAAMAAKEEERLTKLQKAQDGLDVSTKDN